MHRLDRADVEPARRRRRDEHARAARRTRARARPSAGSRPRAAAPARPARARRSGSGWISSTAWSRIARRRSSGPREAGGSRYDLRARFEAMLRFGATPGAEPVLGDVRDAGGDRARADRPLARSRPATATRALGRLPDPGDRLGELALAVAGDARDGDDLARPHDERDAPHGRRAAVALDPDVVELEHDVPAACVAGRRARSGSRARVRPSAPRASAASRRRASTVAIERPPRSTVTRSATAFTSCSLCEMKITVRPSAAISRSVSNSTSASCGVSTAVGSSRIRMRASR